MDIKQIGSVLVCLLCVFLMPGQALELNADVVYELFSRRMDNFFIENILLKTKLEDAILKIENQADKITNLEKASNKFEMQANKIASLEEAIIKLENQAGGITNFEETNKKQNQTHKMASYKETVIKMQKQAERISNLEEVTNKMQNQVHRIPNLEETVNNIENRAKEGMNIENGIQKLNYRIAKLENSTLNNEKVISDVTHLVTENNMNVIKESESSINFIQNVVMKQSATVRKMLSSVKLSFHNKFISFKNDMKLQMSAMNTSVESQLSAMNTSVESQMSAIDTSVESQMSAMNTSVESQMSAMNTSVESQMSSFETFLKLTDNTISVTLNDYSNEVNKTFVSLQKDMKTFVNENERNLETFREKMDKESDQLNVAYGEVQQLQTRIVKVETRQGKRAAFFARSASRQTNGIVRFSTVKLNEGSVYSSSTGEFTCPFPGLYVFIANMIESGGGNNSIYCYIRKNGSSYVYMYSRQGIIDGKGATNGWGAATGSVTVHLAKGDRVHVYCDSFSGAGISHSSFTGFQLSADP